jgi:hypothetical protein
MPQALALTAVHAVRSRPAIRPGTRWGYKGGYSNAGNAIHAVHLSLGVSVEMEEESQVVPMTKPMCSNPNPNPKRQIDPYVILGIGNAHTGR